jgi:hypothetical protein
MRPTIEEALHCNRDENSFTARLFHGVLIPSWQTNQGAFKDFLEFLQKASKKNAEAVKNNFPESKVSAWRYDKGVDSKQSVLCSVFVEVWDLCAYWNSLKPDSEMTADRTEFDAVILFRDSSGAEQLIVFEVKCYTDLESEELERQKEHLLMFSERFRFEPHHFCLISFDNLHNAQKIFVSQLFRSERAPHIVTWDDFFVNSYLPEDLFSRRSFRLSKHIPAQGVPGSERNLVAPDRYEVMP